MKQIFLNKGKIALVDDEDFEKIFSFGWYAKQKKNQWYAAATINYKFVMMHRLIMNLKNPKILIDHKDHNGLNNQKENLKVCTNQENCRNRIGRGTSKYLGVSKYVHIQKYKKKNGTVSIYKSKPKWKSQILITGKVKSIGLFESEEDAAKAYDEKAKIYFKEFANLNFK